MTGSGDKLCARCGGQAVSRVVEGVQVDFCVDCGAVTMERGDLVAITVERPVMPTNEAIMPGEFAPSSAGRASDTFLLDEPTPLPSPERRRGRRRLLGGAASGAFSGSFSGAGLDPSGEADAPTEIDSPTGTSEASGRKPFAGGEGTVRPDLPPGPPGPPALDMPAGTSITAVPSPEREAAPEPTRAAEAPTLPVAEPAPIFEPPMDSGEIPAPPPVDPRVSGRTVRPRNWDSFHGDEPLGTAVEGGPVLPDSGEWRVDRGGGGEPGLSGPDDTEELVDDRTEESFFSGELPLDDTTDADPLASPLDDPQWRESQGRSLLGPVVVAVLVALLLAVLVGGGAITLGLVRGGEPVAPATDEGPPEVVAPAEPAEQSTPAEPVTAEVVVEPAPRPEPTPAPAAATPTPTPTRTPTPTPAPTPAPAPSATPTTTPTAASLSALVDAGWGQVDSGDMAGAASTFKAAVDQAPGSPDANFGYGYVLLDQGDVQGGKPFLCRALRGGDVDLQREAGGLLEHNGLNCD